MPQPGHVPFPHSTHAQEVDRIGAPHNSPASVKVVYKGPRVVATTGTQADRDPSPRQQTLPSATTRADFAGIPAAVIRKLHIIGRTIPAGRIRNILIICLRVALIEVRPTGSHRVVRAVVSVSTNAALSAALLAFAGSCGSIRPAHLQFRPVALSWRSDSWRCCSNEMPDCGASLSTACSSRYQKENVPFCISAHRNVPSFWRRPQHALCRRFQSSCSSTCSA